MTPKCFPRFPDAQSLLVLEYASKFASCRLDAPWLIAISVIIISSKWNTTQAHLSSKAGALTKDTTKLDYL